MKIKMYNVGFGEAVLLKKAANGREENLLVDFGSDTPENCIADIGQTISKNDNVTTEIYNDTKGEEVSVLLSHFHMDHIYGVLETDLLDHVCLKRTYIPNLLLMQSRDNTYSFLQIQILRELFESVYLYEEKKIKFSLYDLLVKLTNNNATLQFVEAGDHFDFAGDSYSVLWPDFGKIKVNKKVSDSLTKLLRLIDADFNDNGEYTLRFIITVSEPALYGWSLILYFVSGHLAVKLMPSTVAYTRTKSKQCSINDKHSMAKITRYFEDVSVKALVETAEDFGLDLKSAISWLILENQQYMKDEKGKQQKANLMTQIMVAVFTAALSNMVNAIGEGTSEAMKKSVTIGSVCIIILGGMLSAYHMKKSMEKSNAEFQIGKNLSEALNYYANSLYKGSSLTII
jgi:hypothetical protein